jgi:hypothetical protein
MTGFMNCARRGISEEEAVAVTLRQSGKRGAGGVRHESNETSFGVLGISTELPLKWLRTAGAAAVEGQGTHHLPWQEKSPGWSPDQEAHSINCLGAIAVACANFVTQSPHGRYHSTQPNAVQIEFRASISETASGQLGTI